MGIWYFQIQELHISAGYYGNLSKSKQTRNKKLCTVRTIFKRKTMKTKDERQESAKKRQEQQQRERQASTDRCTDEVT